MTVSPAALALARKVECEEDGLYFNRYFFKQRFDAKMIISGHHVAMQAALDRTMLPPSHTDFIPRLIITMPPGYTKTEMATIGYMARGLALNAKSRFLHLSYSHKLALTNSEACRGIMKSAAFSEMWGVKTKDDVDSKEIWHTTKGGGVTATAAGGQVTGFRAGHMDEDIFSGALVIDDPVKVDDAHSEVIRDAVNDRYNETIASRVAIETTPIIVIMQRIHWNDLAGYLLGGGSGETWDHLDLPVIIDNTKPYPAEFTHGRPIEHNLPDGWLWRTKHNEKHEIALKAHRRRYHAQYLQRPIKRDELTALWKEKTISKARELSFENPVRTLVSVDPAVSNKKDSDDHGIGVATVYDDPKFHYTTPEGIVKKPPRFSLDADYTIKGSPKDWAERAIMAYKKHDAAGIVIEINQGGDMCSETLRNAGYLGLIFTVHATKGKVIRAEPIAALYELGHVWHKPGLSDVEEEMLDFDPLTGKSNGKSPNRVDWLVWAITELSDIETSFEELLAMAIGQ